MVYANCLIKDGKARFYFPSYISLRLSYLQRKIFPTSCWRLTSGTSTLTVNKILFIFRSQSLSFHGNSCDFIKIGCDWLWRVRGDSEVNVRRWLDYDPTNIKGNMTARIERYMNVSFCTIWTCNVPDHCIRQVLNFYCGGVWKAKNFVRFYCYPLHDKGIGFRVRGDLRDNGMTWHDPFRKRAAASSSLRT